MENEHQMQESQIRKALELESAAYEAPEQLKDTTLNAINDLGSPTLRDRARALRDRRHRPERVQGYPGWVWAAGATAVLAALFLVGNTTTGSRPVAIQKQDRAAGKPASPGAGSAQTRERALGQPKDGAGARAFPAQDSGGEAAAARAPDSPISIPPMPEPVPRGGQFPPKIVHNANLEVRVGKGRFDTQWRRAADIAKRHEGYIVQSSAESNKGQISSGTLTMRIPAGQLQSAIDDFRKLGVVVGQRSSGEDVSASIVDLDARIRTAEGQEAQLLSLLKQAKSVPDTLEVRSRLDGVRQEIESLKGQKEYFDSSVELATLQATLHEESKVAGPPSRLERAWDRAFDAATTVTSGAIVLLGIVAPLVVFGLLGLGAARLIRRRAV